jgi:hypothetical protein
MSGDSFEKNLNKVKMAQIYIFKSKSKKGRLIQIWNPDGRPMDFFFNKKSMFLAVQYKIDVACMKPIFSVLFTPKKVIFWNKWNNLLSQIHIFFNKSFFFRTFSKCLFYYFFSLSLNTHE